MNVPRLKSTHVLPLILALLVILGASGWLAEFLTDWMWYASEGYASVYLGRIGFRLGTGLFFSLGVFLALMGNGVWAVARTRDGAIRVHPVLEQTPLARLPERAVLVRLVILLSAIIAAFFGLATSAWWSDMLLFLNGSPFDYVEPIYDRDAAFYVFNLPMLEHMRNLLFGVTLLSALLCAAVYLIRGAISVTLIVREHRIVGRRARISSEARRHLAAHAASLMILAGFAIYLHRFEIFNQESSRITGPGYKEVYGTLPLLFALSILLFVGAFVVYHSILRQNWRRIGATVISILTVGVLALVYPGVLQRFSVLPNELSREQPFIANHITATRVAFGLDKVEERSLSGQASLSRAEIDSNRGTIQNIRLWDQDPLLETFGQVQEIRTYYKFKSVDNDRYEIGGELVQTMLSPRELAVDDLPSRTWVNERLTYTHGYGVAMGSVNRVDAEGLPELFIKDLPPVVKHPELAITRPEIYFGEESHEPVFVRTETNEFDYPSGNENVYNAYQGQGGASVGSLWRRLLFAIRFGDLKILLASDLNSNSRILFNRKIQERVAKVAPFLFYDSDPYLVIHEGRLVWIMDGYTVSSRFPYALNRTSIGSYIRNSVKVVVDAYTGRMTFYVADEKDPLVFAWGLIFSGLFHPLSEMPESLRAHLRHPEDLFRIQAHIFATYHMNDPKIFYHQDDAWQVPVMPLPGADPLLSEKPMKPYFTIMRLPGEEKSEFIQMLPFTPHGKDNLAAWIAARSDKDHYGELVVYRFPKERMVFGPRQITSRINQDDAISPQLTLWNQQGSNVVLGTLLIIPVLDSLIYVQPLYLRADKGKIPELKRVIVGYDSQIVMAESLEQAINQLFPASGAPRPAGGQSSQVDPGPNPSQGNSTDIPRLAHEARSAYDAARSAAQTGDWARYGTELDRLGKLLSEIEAAGVQP